MLSLLLPEGGPTSISQNGSPSVSATLTAQAHAAITGSASCRTMYEDIDRRARPTCALSVFQLMALVKLTAGGSAAARVDSVMRSSFGRCSFMRPGSRPASVVLRRVGLEVFADGFAD